VALSQPVHRSNGNAMFWPLGKDDIKDDVDIEKDIHR